MKELLTVKELCEELRISRSFWQKLKKENHLKPDFLHFYSLESVESQLKTKKRK